MRILLVGEYSGFHGSLKHGLTQLGHQVTLVGDGDGFKDREVDIDISSNYYRRNYFRRKFYVLWWLLTGRNLEDRLRLLRFRESVKHLINYDIIQFINSNPLHCEPAVEIKMLRELVAKNKKAILVACGDDVPYAQYLHNNNLEYTLLKPLTDGVATKENYLHSLKYLRTGFVNNYSWLRDNVAAIVPSNVDYHLPLINESKATPIIPAAVVLENFKENINYDLSVIQIFLGINRQNFHKKGIAYFEKALDKLKKKYNDKINVTVVENIPYKEYLRKYDRAHILLDQVLTYDQGYNALEAMAQGKVVLAGGSEVYLKAHGLSSVPVIDARPDVDYLVNQLSNLIDNPDLIISKGIEARQHVIEYHDSIKIAKKYEAVYCR